MEDVSKLAWEEQGWTAAQVDEAIDKLSLEEQVGVTKLRLYDNKLSVFPAAILKLVNLEELHLNRNQLSSLPASIGQLAHLKELYVSKNQLSSLPKNMQNLTELIFLNLEGNPALPAKLQVNTWGNAAKTQKALLDIAEHFCQ